MLSLLQYLCYYASPLSGVTRVCISRIEYLVTRTNNKICTTAKHCLHFTKDKSQHQVFARFIMNTCNKWLLFTKRSFV